MQNSNANYSLQHFHGRDIPMSKVKIFALAVSFTLLFLAMIAQPAQANPATRLQTANRYLDDMYDGDEGGFTVPGASASRVAGTFGAIVFRHHMPPNVDGGYLASRPPPFDLVKTKNFTQKVQWVSGNEDDDRYGGFAAYLAGRVSIISTYRAVETWKILDNHNDIPGMEDVTTNFTAALIYVNKTQSTSGGFGPQADASPDLLSTYRALSIMEHAASVTGDTMDNWLQNKTKTTEWIRSCRQGDAFTLTPNARTVGVTPTAAALLALDILGEFQGTDNLQGIANWIKDRQIIESASGEFIGGFQEGVGTNDTNLVSTYFAIQALNLLDTIPDDTSVIAEFVAGCQAADGSWGAVPGLEEGDIVYMAYAARTLTTLDEASILNQEDPNNPAPPLIDWRILFIASLLIIGLVVAVFSVRSD